MKKILMVLFLLLVCVAVAFGQTLVAQTQHELSNFFYELDNGVRRLYYFCG